MDFNGTVPLLALGGAIAAGMVLCLFLFGTVKAEVGAFRRVEARRAAATAAELDGLRAECAALAAAMAEIEARTGALVAPPPAPSGLNLSKRAQVLRRHRLGEDPAAIAAAMELPVSEVDLLLKVNQIVLETL